MKKGVFDTFSFEFALAQHTFVLKCSYQHIISLLVCGNIDFRLARLNWTSTLDVAVKAFAK